MEAFFPLHTEYQQPVLTHIRRPQKGKTSCERKHSAMSGSNAVPHPLPSKVPHAKPDLLIAVRRRSWSCGVAIAPSFFTVGI